MAELQKISSQENIKDNNQSPAMINHNKDDIGGQLNHTQSIQPSINVHDSIGIEHNKESQIHNAELEKKLHTEPTVNPQANHHHKDETETPKTEIDTKIHNETFVDPQVQTTHPDGKQIQRTGIIVVSHTQNIDEPINMIVQPKVTQILEAEAQIHEDQIHTPISEIQVIHPEEKQIHNSDVEMKHQLETLKNQNDSNQHDGKHDESNNNNLPQAQKSQTHIHLDKNLHDSNKNDSLHESIDKTNEIINQDQLDKTNQSLHDSSVIHEKQQNTSFSPNNQSQSSILKEQTTALITKYTLAHEQSDNEIEKNILLGTLEQLRQKLNQLEKQRPPLMPKSLNSQEQIRQNLLEIYSFYAKQTFMNGKSATFEKLLHINHVLTMGKYMYFCRDFQIINLEFELSQIIKILQLQGLEVQQIQQPNLKRHSKYILPRKSIVDKQTLVEFFKKCSSNGKELSFNEFELSLQKIAEFAYKHILDQIQVTDQVKPNAIILFLLFLQIQKPSEYRKKMLIVGVPFEMRDRVIEKISQEKLKRKPPAKQIIQHAAPKDPKDPKYLSKQLIDLIEDDNEFLGEEPKQKSPQKVGEQITWHHLSQVKLEDMNNKNFNPKDLLQDVDFDDQEDNIYLQEYSLKQPTTKEVIVVPELDTRDRTPPKINYKYAKNRLGGSVDQSQSKQIPNQGNYLNDDYSRDNKLQPKKDLPFLVRGNSSQRQKIGQETLARAQQIEMQSLKREQVLYQQLLKNQDQKQQKMTRKI